MKFAVEPIESGADIIEFSVTFVVLSFAQTCSAEVEAEHGKSEAVKSFHGVEHDFVVQSSTEDGMRMADQRGMGGVRRAHVKQGFEASGGTFEEK